MVPGAKNLPRSRRADIPVRSSVRTFPGPETSPTACRSTPLRTGMSARRWFGAVQVSFEWRANYISGAGYETPNSAGHFAADNSVLAHNINRGRRGHPGRRGITPQKPCAIPFGYPSDAFRMPFGCPSDGPVIVSDCPVDCATLSSRLGCAIGQTVGPLLRE